MNRRILVTSSAVAALALGLAATPASAGNNVAWSVSIGGPGYVVSAGEPSYWGPNAYYGQPRAYVAPPVYYPAPIVYSAPVVYAPRPYYRPYVAPRHVYYGHGRDNGRDGRGHGRGYDRGSNRGYDRD